MRKIAELTLEQIDQAWELALPVEGEDPNEVRRDFVGARIHRKNTTLKRSMVGL